MKKKFKVWKYVTIKDKPDLSYDIITLWNIFILKI